MAFNRRWKAVLWAASMALAASTGCGSKSDSGDGPANTGDENGDDTTGGDTSGDSQSSTFAEDDSNGDDSTPTTGNTTDPTASDDDTGMDFISEPDGGVTGECDPSAQDCPDGEKCNAYSNVEGEPWNATKCVEVMGMGQVGDPCDIQGGKYTGEDDCDVGLVCLLTDDDGNGGACVEFCDEQMQCPDSGGNCAVYNDGALPICLTTCNPLASECPEGQGCYSSAAGNEFVCFKYSGMGGEGAPGDECNFINQCQPGTACLAPDAVEGCGAQSGCCSPYCDRADANPEGPCNPTEMCELFFENPPPEYADVGVCAIPSA